MRIVWSESGDGEWQGSCGRYAITIVYQPDEQDEPWVWGITRDDGTTLAAGYETSLEVARREAERTIVRADSPPVGTDR